MQDFAGLLVDARKKTGMTQAQLAITAGLTPSYLSFIENRKKPPPSDEVCRRLAQVLKIPEKTVLEVAHMQRAPDTVQKKVKNLTHSLKRERRTRLRTLKSLLTPFLFAGPPGFRESALDALGISPVRRRRIREVLTAVGRTHQDQEREVSKIVDELPERERNLLLEKIPEILSRSREEEDQADDQATRPGPLPHRAEPPLLYGAPAKADGVKAAYRLEVTDEVAAGFVDLRAGDEIVVDPEMQPGLGDLAVLRGESGYLVRRLEADGEEFRFACDGDDAGDVVPAIELVARLERVCAGTVVEIRRPLRRRPPR